MGDVVQPKQEFLSRELRLFDLVTRCQGFWWKLLKRRNIIGTWRRKVMACHKKFRKRTCDQNHSWARAENSCSCRLCPHCAHRRAGVLARRTQALVVGKNWAAVRGGKRSRAVENLKKRDRLALQGVELASPVGLLEGESARLDCGARSHLQQTAPDLASAPECPDRRRIFPVRGSKSRVAWCHGGTGADQSYRASGCGDH